MPETTLIYCPFCDKKTVMAFYIALSAGSNIGGRTITGKRGRIVYEKYEILSGCTNCGKSIEEIKKKMQF